MTDMFGGFGLFALLWFVLILAFWAVIIVLAVLGIRWLIRNTGSGMHSGAARPSEDTALELLRQRFARGEIDAAEFEERKRALGG